MENHVRNLLIYYYYYLLLLLIFYYYLSRFARVLYYYNYYAIPTSAYSQRIYYGLYVFTKYSDDDSIRNVKL